MKTFNLNNKQWGLVNSGALIVATILYPLWGYLYDRYSRTKLLSLASFIWGATTWLNAIVRTFGGFLVTRASTGIDDSSYPGLVHFDRRLFRPEPARQNLWHFAARTASWIFGWDDPRVDHRAHDRRLAFNVFYITGSLGLISGSADLFRRKGNAARTSRTGI